MADCHGCPPFCIIDIINIHILRKTRNKDLQFCKLAHIICHDFEFKGEISLKELSRIAEAVQASTTMAIDAMFKQMKADGIDVIGFGAGEPDFDTP